jgi:hypothetical protein
MTFPVALESSSWERVYLQFIIPHKCLKNIGGIEKKLPQSRGLKYPKKVAGTTSAAGRSVGILDTY